MATANRFFIATEKTVWTQNMSPDASYLVLKSDWKRPSSYWDMADYVILAFAKVKVKVTAQGQKKVESEMRLGSWIW